MVQHRDIVDAQRHEPKGASTALEGQVLTSNGNGTTRFANPSSLRSVSVNTLSNSTTSSQNPGAVNQPLIVSFGSAMTSPFANLSADGLVTFSQAGAYTFTAILNFARLSGDEGTSTFAARVILNDEDILQPAVLTVPDVNFRFPIVLSDLIVANAGDTLQVQIIRLTGLNIGGLAQAETPTEWPTAPSAALRLHRLQGVG